MGNDGCFLPTEDGRGRLLESHPGIRHDPAFYLATVFGLIPCRPAGVLRSTERLRRCDAPM